MPEKEDKQSDQLARVPEPLRELVATQVPPEQICAWAPYDLDEQGSYVTGYLALSADRLGHFV
ncbi:hypothetical protein LCGC14_2688990, partial [marine sediment metagenome]